MRIFFITNSFTPYSGGVVQSITALVHALHKEGHEVFVITLTFSDKHNDPEWVIRIPCPIKFMYKKNYMAIPWRPTHAIEKLIIHYKPDIIHVHHPFLLGASALHAAQKYKIPCAFTYHTLYEQYAHYIPFSRNIVQPIIRTIVRRFCNKVDTIIAPSNYVKNYLQLQHITTSIEVIPSPLRECFNNTIRKQPKKHSSYFELLLVTRFVPEKNIPLVFEVMQLLPDNFRLTLVGYGSDEQRLKTLAFDTLDFSPHRVRFIHKPHEQQLIEIYRNADLFIFPSQTDTQGIVLAESMSQEVPVIALDGPGQRDIIINGVNGFIVKDTQEMAHIIAMLANDPLQLNILALAARETAYRYNAQYIAQKIITIYDETIRKKKIL